MHSSNHLKTVLSISENFNLYNFLSLTLANKPAALSTLSHFQTILLTVERKIPNSSAMQRWETLNKFGIRKARWNSNCNQFFTIFTVLYLFAEKLQDAFLLFEWETPAFRSSWSTWLWHSKLVDIITKMKASRTFEESELQNKWCWNEQAGTESGPLFLAVICHENLPTIA